MFKRFLDDAMTRGPCILFAAAILMLIAGIAYVADESHLVAGNFGPGHNTVFTAVALLYQAFAPACYLFFAALVITRADRLLERIRG